LSGSCTCQTPVRTVAGGEERGVAGGGGGVAGP